MLTESLWRNNSELWGEWPLESTSLESKLQSPLTRFGSSFYLTFLLYEMMMLKEKPLQKILRRVILLSINIELRKRSHSHTLTEIQNKKEGALYFQLKTLNT